MRTAPPVEIYIERLIVNGIAEAERARLVAVIEREVRALAHAPSWLTGGLAPRPVTLDRSTVDVPPGLGVDQIGAQVARSIWTACERAVGQRTGLDAQTPSPESDSGRTPVPARARAHAQGPEEDGPS